MPPLHRQLISFLSAAVRTLLARHGRFVSRAERDRRLALCEPCDYRAVGKRKRDDRCAACGCWLSIKATLRSETCPDGRWPNPVPLVEHPR